MNRSIPLAAVLLTLAPIAAGAQTLAQKQTMAYEETALASAAKNMNDYCHTAIAAGYDWQSFLATNTLGDKNAIAYDNPPSDMCSVPLTDLQALCQDPQGRQAITAKIKSYSCAYQAGATPTLSLDPSGRLLFQSSYDAFHHMDHTTETAFVRDWLGNHL